MESSPVDMESSADLLFVYGSLLPDAPNSRHHLLGPVTPLGPGYFQGRLYSLGGYPGAVASRNTNERVRGVIYRLKSPEASLQQLDRYEGFVPSSPEGCEFIRASSKVFLDNGTTPTAWIYLYALPLEGLIQIPEGDYLRFLRCPP